MTDLAVVGAGIVGLAHAVEAVRRGLSVTVIERDERAVGASVRNFGHSCVTAQTGERLAFGERGRATWLRLAREAGFWAAECGAVVVARSGEELDALAELAGERGDDVAMLDAAQTGARVPVAGDGLLGGAFFRRDLRVDQRAAPAAIAAWLAARPGVRMSWSTAVTGLDRGVVHTSRGDVHATRTVVCTGHDLDRIAPAVTEAAGVRRCVLQMLQVRAPGVTVAPAVLTGTSILRYPALSGTKGARALRERWAQEDPLLLEAAVNHMLTQLPCGDLVVGDTHAYGATPPPWSSEELDELLLARTRALLGRSLEVVHRWQGVYPSAAEPFLRAPVGPGALAVAVTSGVGMTTAFGLAADVFDHHLEDL